jgi:hypothetical protein
MPVPPCGLDVALSEEKFRGILARIWLADRGALGIQGIQDRGLPSSKLSCTPLGAEFSSWATPGDLMNRGDIISEHHKLLDLFLSLFHAFLYGEGKEHRKRVIGGHSNRGRRTVETFRFHCSQNQGSLAKNSADEKWGHGNAPTARPMVPRASPSATSRIVWIVWFLREGVTKVSYEEY